jgi:hypothetical protein
MAEQERSHDPAESSEELREESREEGERVKEAEEAPFTARGERMHEAEDSEEERKGKKTSKDYA